MIQVLEKLVELREATTHMPMWEGYESFEQQILIFLLLGVRFDEIDPLQKLSEHFVLVLIMLLLSRLV